MTPHSITAHFSETPAASRHPPLAPLATAYIPEPPVLTLDTPLEHAALVVVRAYLGALKAAKLLWLNFKEPG